MKTYMTRTCSADMKSFYGTFTWPESGPVECPDWDPKRECGHGLHGLWLGCGDGTLLDWTEDAKWLVVEIDREDIVDLDGKIKVPRGTVVYAGTRKEAIAKLEALAPECLTMPVVGATRTAEKKSTATAGPGGTATAGDDGTAIAGDYGTAMAGNRGRAMAGYDGYATAGYRGIATVGYRGTATAGDEGSATTGDYGTAIVGSRATAIAGNGGRAMAGYGSKIFIDWYDSRYNRMRTVTGYVGEDGIEPNKLYQVDPDTGTLVLAE